MVSKTPKSYYKPYLWLCVLRVVLVFIPQTGYIHPDEFFQTVEVFAGRIFELDVSLPWEFNATSPARSMGVPYLAIGFGYKIMQTLDYFLRIYFKFTIITPYFLLIFPRFFLCMLTFLVDYSLYKICLNNNEKYRSRLLILASSYVVLVFSSHTFTNSIEMILFAILLFFVSESMIFSNIIVRQREYINKRYDKSTTPAERAKFHKLRIFLASDSYRNCFQISTVAVMGFFNRPTFLFYCLFPIFFWLYRGIGFKSVTSMQFHTRILALIACAIPTILALIIFDSFFFGYITWGEIGMLDVSVNSFVFPPLNFIKYNMDQENLALHGIHPRYNHVLLNVPLLYNVLGIFAIIGLSDMLRNFSWSSWPIIIIFFIPLPNPSDLVLRNSILTACFSLAMSFFNWTIIPAHLTGDIGNLITHQTSANTNTCQKQFKHDKQIPDNAKPILNQSLNKAHLKQMQYIKNVTAMD